MNVLVITPVYPHSGNPTEGLFNEQHALALTRAGIRVTVVVCKPWLPSRLAWRWKRYRSLSNLPKTEERNGIPILYARYLHVPQYRWPHFTVVSCGRSVENVIREFSLDETFEVMQVHSAWPVGLAAPTIANALACPFVLTLHIQDDSRLFASGRGATLYKRMLESASAVVSVGRPLKRFVQQLMPSLNGRSLRVIPNGVDLSAANGEAEKTYGRNQDWGSIISVCNLWPVKGVDFNLRALAHLNQTGICWKRYTVIGDGPEMARLKKLAGELGIGDRVHFTGRLPHQEVLREVAKADIFSLPSWQEAFGVVYLEAMACGKPVIGCRSQGAEDIVRHEKDGILVDPRDIGSLVRAIKRLLIDRQFAHELGLSAMKRARVFTWEQNVKQYVEVYKEVISRTPIASQNNHSCSR